MVSGGGNFFHVKLYISLRLLHISYLIPHSMSDALAQFLSAPNAQIGLGVAAVVLTIGERSSEACKPLLGHILALSCCAKI